MTSFFFVLPRLLHKVQVSALVANPHPHTPRPPRVLQGPHLCVGLGHLLIQGLVVVDGQLQVLHLGGQASLTAHLAPGVHSRQELEGHSSCVSAGALGAGDGPWEEASGPLGASEANAEGGVFLFNSTNINPMKEARHGTFVESVVSTNKNDFCETFGVPATCVFNRLYPHTDYNVCGQLAILHVYLRVSRPVHTHRHTGEVACQVKWDASPCGQWVVRRNREHPTKPSGTPRNLQRPLPQGMEMNVLRASHCWVSMLQAVGGEGQLRGTDSTMTMAALVLGM